jgi:hypothetical protein
LLVDTSLLVRALQPEHPLCGIAKNAIDSLRLKGRRLYVAPQNLVEFSKFRIHIELLKR